MVSVTDHWAKNQLYYGLGLEYSQGGLKTALIFDVRDQKGRPQTATGKYIYEGKSASFSVLSPFNISNDNGSLNLDKIISGDYGDLKITNNVIKPIYSISFGIGYDFEYLKPQFGYTWTQQSDVASQHTFGLSTGIPLAGGDFNIGVRYVIGYLNGALKRMANTYLPHDNYGLFTANLYYSYPLSKRTWWYGYAGYTTGNKLYHYTGLVSNLFNGSTINTNGYALQVGMKHTF
ncbi:MAG: hypothetical protein LUC43_05975, partial [Burkholderiales bacterium]|nr:hypothetical protein [Burkholderiales bacterium]